MNTPLAQSIYRDSYRSCDYCFYVDANRCWKHAPRLLDRATTSSILIDDAIIAAGQVIDAAVILGVITGGVFVSILFMADFLGAAWFRYPTLTVWNWLHYYEGLAGLVIVYGMANGMLRWLQRGDHE